MRPRSSSRRQPRTCSGSSGSRRRDIWSTVAEVVLRARIRVRSRNSMWMVRARRSFSRHADLCRRVAEPTLVSAFRQPRIDATPSGPRSRAQRERSLGKQRATALAKLRPPTLVKAGDEGAGRTDSERVRLPPVVEARMLATHRQDSRRDVAAARQPRTARRDGPLAFRACGTRRPLPRRSHVRRARTRRAGPGRPRDPRPMRRRHLPTASPDASPAGPRPGPA